LKPDIPLEFAGTNYWDRTQPLISGRVKPEGVDLQWASHPAGMVFGQMARGEFQAGEMSAAFLVILADQGNDTLVGVPIFTTRGFRHGDFVVRADAGINTPADLRGRRVGCSDYPRTSTVWARGLLEHEYGVRARDVAWFHGEEDPAYNSRIAYELPPDIKLTAVSGTTPADMFLRGELDAFVGATQFRKLLRGSSLRLLFPDYQQEERAYFRRTGIFPFNHVVTLRRDVYQDYPWMAVSLMQAFEEAKKVGAKEMVHQASLMLPWMSELVEDVFEFFGGHPYRDGFRANYAAIEALCHYCHEQGLTKRLVRPEELFAPETLDLAFG